MVETIGWALVHFTWQGTVIGLLVAIGLFLLRSNSASVRYSAACVGLALMLALPVGTIVESVWLHVDAPSYSPANAPTDECASCGDMSGPSTASSSPRTGVVTAESIDLESWLPTAVQMWFAGVVALSIRMMGSWILVQNLRRRATVPAASICHAAVMLAGRMRVTRPVQILESTLVKVPTAIGWLRPVILLPAAALTGLSTEQIEAVLAHEFAHIRRYDYFVNILQTMVETLLFYHPAVWYVSRRIRIERENCCDDLAVEVCGNRLIYAQTLADLEAIRSRNAVLAMSATGGSLLMRVRRVLEGSTTNRRTGPAWMAIWLMAGTLVFTLTGKQVSSPLVQRTPQAEPQAPPPAPPPPQPAPLPPAPPPPQASIKDEGQISWSHNGARMEIRYKGAITLSDDDRDISAISPDGYLEVANGGFLQANNRIEVRSRPNGTLERKYFVKGREVAYEPDGRAWLAATLPDLVRRTGIAADSRVARILKRSGASGVLNEITLLASDYVRRIYYKAFFDQAQPTGTSTIQALSQAGRDVSSDYELAELLISVSKQSMTDDSTRVAYFNAAKSIESDYELRRVLTHATAQSLDRRPLEEALSAAQSIDSDYELAELLVAVANTQTLDPSRSKAYFEAVDMVGSDYECRRVLSAMAERNLTGELLLDVLRSVRGIGSDYERATLLALIATKHQLSGAARDLYLELIEEMSSDYERNKALAALVKRG